MFSNWSWSKTNKYLALIWVSVCVCLCLFINQPLYHPKLSRHKVQLSLRITAAFHFGILLTVPHAYWLTLKPKGNRAIIRAFGYRAVGEVHCVCANASFVVWGKLLTKVPNVLNIGLAFLTQTTSPSVVTVIVTLRMSSRHFNFLPLLLKCKHWLLSLTGMIWIVVQAEE